MKHNAPRLLLGGTGSGCGKTTVTLALLRAWQRQGIPLAAFKCGPDYIDPMFHTAVLGVPSRNLDLYFMEETQVCAALARRIPLDGLGVVEGAMGFYDGVSGTTDTASQRAVAFAGSGAARLSYLCEKYARRRDFERRFRCDVSVLPDDCRAVWTAGVRFFAACG